MRPDRKHTLTFDSQISIHAPAKGATLLPNGLSDVLLDFNPRTREGCDIDGIPDAGRVN